LIIVISVLFKSIKTIDYGDLKYNCPVMLETNQQIYMHWCCNAASFQVMKSFFHLKINCDCCHFRKQKVTVKLFHLKIFQRGQKVRKRSRERLGMRPKNPDNKGTKAQSSNILTFN
jgi:hypothetical protein